MPAPGRERGSNGLCTASGPLDSGSHPARHWELKGGRPFRVCGVREALWRCAVAVYRPGGLGAGRFLIAECGAGERSISWRLATTDAVLAGLGVLVAVGPSSALALWDSSAGSGGLVASRTIPIPLIVITAAGLCRLVQQGVWLRPTRSSVSRSAAPAALNVIRPSDVGRVAASTGS